MRKQIKWQTKTPRWYIREVKHGLDEHKKINSNAEAALEEWIESQKQKGKRLSKRQKQIAKWSSLQIARGTEIGRVAKTAHQIEEIAKSTSSKKLIINDIGFGGSKYKIGNSVYEPFLQTYEPFFIANALKKLGKDYQINAYAMNPHEVESAKTQKSIHIEKNEDSLDIAEIGKIRNKEGIQWVKIPKDILNRIKVNELDLMISTPSEKADITTIRGIPYIGHRMKWKNKDIMTLLKNAVDSTKEKGYILTEHIDTQYDNRIICKKLGLKKINDRIYQKI